MSTDWRKPTDNISVLLDTIIEHIPAPEYIDGPSQMLITSLDFSSYVGRIAIGRIHRGELHEGQDIVLCKRDGSTVKQRIKELHIFEGMGRTKVESAASGEICALVGIDGFEIGDTIADINTPEALPRIAIDEPTMSMTFTNNDSPFFGRDGKFVTSRHIAERLEKELERNLALRVVKAPEDGVWTVYGRGVLHLSILIETMRREGYELQVGQPAGHRQRNRRGKVRTGRTTHHQCPRRIFEQNDRYGNPAQRRPAIDGNTRRPHTSRILDSLARYHRPAQ